MKANTVSQQLLCIKNKPLSAAFNILIYICTVSVLPSLTPLYKFIGPVSERRKVCLLGNGTGLPLNLLLLLMRNPHATNLVVQIEKEATTKRQTTLTVWQGFPGTII